MLRLMDLLSPVRTEIDKALEVFRRELDSDQAFIRDHCDHIDRYHGKQLRPALLLLTAAACGRVTSEHHVLAAVVEMVHLATLVHDDILDEADMRRGASTVNRLWGNERAVLLGDYLFSHAYHLCSSLDSQYAARVIGRTGVRLCEGEMMQVANRNNLELTEEQYLDIITRKTASLIAAAGLLGARYAGADELVVQHMHAFGESVGIAFQVVDDLLDITGDENEVGKSLGRDVQEGKLTLALIHYLREQPAKRQEAMLSLLRSDASDRPRQVAAMLVDSDSLDYASQVAYAHVQRALEHLDEIPRCAARESLRAMAEFTVSRRR